MNAIFGHDYPLAVEPATTPRPLVQKKTWRYSLPIDMLLSAVSVLVVAQSSSEIPEGFMNNSVYIYIYINAYINTCGFFGSIFHNIPSTLRSLKVMEFVVAVVIFSTRL